MNTHSNNNNYNKISKMKMKKKWLEWLLLQKKLVNEGVSHNTLQKPILSVQKSN